eukprot:505467-Rhodomonas_salina.1
MPLFVACGKRRGRGAVDGVGAVAEDELHQGCVGHDAGRGCVAEARVRALGNERGGYRRVAEEDGRLREGEVGVCGGRERG